MKKLWQTSGSKHPVRVMNLTLWQDGLSGNRTKKWNPHEATLLSFPGILSSVCISALSIYKRKNES